MKNRWSTTSETPSIYGGLGRGELIPQGATVEQATYVSFLEGPAADRDGTLFFSDIAGNRIMSLSPNGSLDVFREKSGRANGNAFDLEGHLITCEGAEHGPYGRRRMVRTDVHSGETTVLTERFDGARYNSPNDVVVDARGRIYFTDPRYGDRSDMELEEESVYRIDVDGSVHRILSQPTIQRPNGLAISPDGSTLYVIDSNPLEGGNRKIWAFELDADGQPSDRRLFHDFAPGRGGDGMEVDQRGNLFVCAGIMTPRSSSESSLVPPGVYMFRPSGELIGRIPIPQDTITNCCFGGEDLRTLFVTAGPTVYRIGVDSPGYHAYPVHAD